MEKGVTVENGVCHEETINGGHDVWSCENGNSSLSADHLVIMVHGILGSATDWKFGADQFVKKLPDKVYVHCSERNGASRTLDGVDVMAQRLAEEVLEIIRHKPELRKISFVAHSVGGLVARYAIGILFQPHRDASPMDSSNSNACENSRGTIGGLEAVNFITVATPHLGSRGKKQVPFLFGMTSLEKVAGKVIHWIFRRTDQLYGHSNVEWPIQMLDMTVSFLCDKKSSLLPVILLCYSFMIAILGFSLYSAEETRGKRVKREKIEREITEKRERTQ